MQEKNNEVLRKVLLCLAEKVRERKVSYNKISEIALEQFGIKVSPYQVRSVANGKFRENNVVKDLDKYIDAVLKVIGMTDRQLLFQMTSYLNRTTHGKICEMRKELREFVDNPNNIQYLEFAFKTYKLKNEEKELKKMENQL